MVSTVVLLVTVAVVCAIGALASGPATERRRARDLSRRLRYVERHPQRVNLGDIESLMRAHEMPEDEIRLLTAKARSRGIRPLTMWMWVQQRGVHTLAVVVAADLSHEALISHLAHGTVPDLAELEVFAALNGLTRSAAEPTRPVVVTAAAVAPSARPAAPSVTARHDVAPGALPPVVAPGTWPYGDIRDILGGSAA
ncbi:hypothetical protein I601_3441 [Nocardioides dokdonensis FR1436]|uniref:Uncharacterized protein n=1 Tax=Nocardioides dokdonensis FR1436 TaxID=1300347 RepID=A0A1A9GNE5_9ACTN|nr:hypothetical protein [Nocardioides dokdonensis]ANH39847.1 hypothetical protein I601_3441 [Nocardioides dokdonensis FR1436]